MLTIPIFCSNAAEADSWNSGEYSKVGVKGQGWVFDIRCKIDGKTNRCISSSANNSMRQLLEENGYVQLRVDFVRGESGTRPMIYRHIYFNPHGESVLSMTVEYAGGGSGSKQFIGGLIESHTPFILTISEEFIKNNYLNFYSPKQCRLGVSDIDDCSPYILKPR